MDALTLAEHADELAKQANTLRVEFTKTSWDIVRSEDAGIPELVFHLQDVGCELDKVQDECKAHDVIIKAFEKETGETILRESEKFNQIYAMQRKEENRILVESLRKAHFQVAQLKARKSGVPQEKQGLTRKEDDLPPCRPVAVPVVQSVIVSIPIRREKPKGMPKSKRQRVLDMPEYRPFFVRPCAPKVQYCSEWEAQDAMVSLIQSGKDKNKEGVMHVYFCPDCHTYHNGHTKEKI